jgi:hypothetical protein
LSPAVKWKLQEERLFSDGYLPKMHGEVFLSGRRSVLGTIAVATCVAIAAMLAFSRGKPLGPTPHIDFTNPLPKSAAVEFLQGEFTIIKDVKSLPSPVLKAFTEVGGSRPVMANPGQKFEVGDFITDASVPQKRLLFAGVSRDRCFVHYEQGGRGHLYLLALFQLLPEDSMKPIWKGYCEPAKDIQNLRLEIENGHCRQ